MIIYPTQDQVRALFDYKDGGLYWKTPRNKIRVGDRAGHTNKRGYRKIKINSNCYQEHHVIWLWHHGTWPKDQIDHINRIRDDNRIENLRECSNAENHQNRKLSPKNTSGQTGVYWSKVANKWHSRITLNNKRIHLGFYDNLEDAAAAYLVAKKQHHTFSD